MSKKLRRFTKNNYPFLGIIILFVIFVVLMVTDVISKEALDSIGNYAILFTALSMLFIIIKAINTSANNRRNTAQQYRNLLFKNTTNQFNIVNDMFNKVRIEKELYLDNKTLLKNIQKERELFETIGKEYSLKLTDYLILPTDMFYIADYFSNILIICADFPASYKINMLLLGKLNNTIAYINPITKESSGILNNGEIKLLLKINKISEETISIAFSIVRHVMRYDNNNILDNSKNEIDKYNKLRYKQKHTLKYLADIPSISKSLKDSIIQKYRDLCAYQDELDDLLSNIRNRS
jgi:hypothetical protein